MKKHEIIFCIILLFSTSAAAVGSGDWGVSNGVDDQGTYYQPITLPLYLAATGNITISDCEVMSGPLIKNDNLWVMCGSNSQWKYSTSNEIRVYSPDGKLTYTFPLELSGGCENSTPRGDFYVTSNRVVVPFTGCSDIQPNCTSGVNVKAYTHSGSEVWHVRDCMVFEWPNWNTSTQ